MHKKRILQPPALQLLGAGKTAGLIACAYTTDVVRGGTVRARNPGECPTCMRGSSLVMLVQGLDLV